MPRTQDGDPANPGLRPAGAGRPAGGGAGCWSYAVLGPGGLGGLFAGLLARDGHQVACVAREPTAARLRAGGLTLRSAAFGDVTLGGDGLAFGVATALAAPVDACLVTVKATHLDEALERVPPANLGGGLVVPFLNGFEHVEILRRRYPPDQVVPATIAVEAYVEQPGVAIHSSPFARVVLAAERADRDRVETLAGNFRHAGMTVDVRDSETQVLWDKLSFLGPTALLTTDTAAPLGVVRTEHREELLALFSEYAAVARALGADVDPGRAVGLVDRFPPATETSMQRDAAAGRPIELDAIGGALLRSAAGAGVDVPTTARLVARLQQHAGR